MEWRGAENGAEYEGMAAIVDVVAAADSGTTSFVMEIFAVVEVVEGCW